MLVISDLYSCPFESLSRRSVSLNRRAVALHLAHDQIPDRLGRGVRRTLELIQRASLQGSNNCGVVCFVTELAWESSMSPE